MTTMVASFLAAWIIVALHRWVLELRCRSSPSTITVGVVGRGQLMGVTEPLLKKALAKTYYFGIAYWIGSDYGAACSRARGFGWQ
jgi:hypothetical protein